MDARGLRVLMLVENQAAPPDRRVWSEALALRDAGMAVSVVCPARPYAPVGSEVIDGITVHRYPAREALGGGAGHVLEYLSAAWNVRRCARRLARTQQFDVVHAANPPDFLLLVCHFLKRPGVVFVFDHHDLVPEMLVARFGRFARVLEPVARVLERLTFAVADVVISTNESYRQTAVGRGRKAAGDVFVVRNAPDTRRFCPGEGNPALRGESRHLLAYVGAMDRHDGVVGAVRSLGHLRHLRDDWRAIFAGHGGAVPQAAALAAELGIAEFVEFVGHKDEEAVIEILRSADVCLSPEPPNPYCDASTMIKVAEYMAVGKPIVAYDLTETRFTTGGAARLVADASPAAFAGAVDELLGDPEGRAALGAAARRRILDNLTWTGSRQQLSAAYERVAEIREQGLASGTRRRVRPEPAASEASA